MIHTEPARNETKHDKGSSEVYKVNSKSLLSQLIRSLHIYEATLNVHDGDMYLVRGQLTFPLAKTFIHSRRIQFNWWPKIYKDFERIGLRKLKTKSEITQLTSDVFLIHYMRVLAKPL